MIKELFLLIAFLIIGSSFSQSLKISGQVIDEDGHPIVDARYYFAQNPNQKFKTNSDGRFSIQFKAGSLDTLKFEHFGFDDFNLAITPKMERRALKGKLNKIVTLPFLTGDVIEVVSNVPDTLFGTQDYSVADFEFDKSGQVILLTYEKTVKKGSVLRLLDTNQQIIDSYYVIGNAIELRTDFRNNTHLITEERVYLIQVVENKLHLFLESRDYYFRYVAPLIDTIGDYIYFSNYSDVYPAFDYLEFNRKDSIYTTIKTVEDTFMMEMYRSEFKYVDVRTKLWAHNKQIETGIDKEIWVGASVFTKSVYYEPLYAPLFKVGADSIFVFDHYKNKLYKYTPTDGFVDSVRINYHENSRKSGWDQPLIQDRKKDVIYATFLRNGYTYLSQIDSRTGFILKSFRLHFKYVERLRIIDGYVYYIYRPFESVQKKYIYKERLK